jgi:hypothetical protein
MRQHRYEMHDRLFNLKEFPSSKGLFYDIGHIIHRHLATVGVPFVNPNILFKATIW